jgi:hypothetical protein
MKTLITGLTFAALLACTTSTFAGPGAKGERKPRDPDQIFKKLDANSDGKLTFEEFKGQRPEERAKKAFARMDANNDSAISREEFKLPERKKKND